MKCKKDLGLYIQQKRKEHGYTQLELAELLFVTESAVSKWERGLTYPDITMISDICKALEINEHEFITATNDTEFRKMKNDAKKYSTIVWALFISFSIMYGAAILSCFIVNLAVSHELSWFFIVFFGCLSGFCVFPGLSLFFKRNKLIIHCGSALLSLLLLLLTICIYCDGSWFFMAGLGTILGFSLVFTPIIIAKYPVFPIMKRHNAIFSVGISALVLVLLLLACNIYCNGNWFIITLTSLVVAYFLVFGLPILSNIKFPPFLKDNKVIIWLFSSYVLILVLLASVLSIDKSFDFGKSLIISLYFLLPVVGSVAIYMYLDFKKIYKVSIIVSLAGFAYYFANFIICLIYNISFSYAVNFGNWSEYINGNIYLLVLISCILASIILIVIGYFKERKNEKDC